jgi:hypothetical protein
LTRIPVASRWQESRGAPPQRLQHDGFPESNVNDLILPLKGISFDQIEAGTKTEEYRLQTPYWRERLEGREYRNVILTRGYPRADDHERRLVRPWLPRLKR